MCGGTVASRLEAVANSRGVSNIVFVFYLEQRVGSIMYSYSAK